MVAFFDYYTELTSVVEVLPSDKDRDGMMVFNQGCAYLKRVLSNVRQHI